jgi:hypothetical protein
MKISMSEFSKVISLSNLVILKTIAFKEKLYSSQSLNNEDKNLIIALYCREILILIREIELINRVDNR